MMVFMHIVMIMIPFILIYLISVIKQLTTPLILMKTIDTIIPALSLIFVITVDLE